MKKHGILNKILNSGVIAVIRAEETETAKRIIAAVRAGGISAIEVTMTVPGALEVIKELAGSKDEDIVLGVGSVLDPETARSAILAGAEYVVSPHLNEDVVRLCNRYQIPCMSGAATASEVVKAMEAGTDIIKVFPGEVMGPKFIKAILGPIPQAPLMPTGGVTLENVQEWVAAGAVAVGAGGSLTMGAKSGDYQLITENARQLVNKFKEAKGSKRSLV